MKKAIIRDNLLLLLGAFVLFFIIVFFSLYTFEKRNKETFMTYVLNEVEMSYETYIGTPQSFVDTYGYEDRRITILNADAIVIADSHHTNLGYDESNQYEMVNLGSVATRTSSHIGVDLLYIAKALDDGSYLRVSVTLETQSRLYSVIIWSLTGGSLGIGVLYYFGLKQVNKNLLQPWQKVRDGLLALNKGKYQIMSLTSPYKEINEMLYEMNNINEETAKHLSQIESYQLQLNRILNALQQAVLLFNKEEMLTYYNSDAKRLFHIDDTDLNAPGYAFIRDHDLKQAIHETNESQRDHVLDIVLDEHIFETRIIHLETSESFDQQPRILVVLHDVTDQRKLEQVKKDFISHASHELKSPLTVIKGNAELIVHDMLKTKDEIKESAIQINKQTVQMTALVEDMLMLSRLENISELSHQRCDLSLVLNDVIELLKPEADQKHIKLKVTSDKVVMVCDQLDMHKLFKNLIENAIKYSHENKEIEILLQDTDKEIIFSVKDQGIGIAKEHQQRIFERFYRVDKGRIDKGTGLGLAIVKHIVLKYKGQITLKSSLQKGTEIHIFFEK